MKKILDSFKTLDKIVKIIMKNGLKFCSIICLISILLLTTYNSINNPLLFTIGFGLFKISLIFGTEFVICGFAADKIKKELI